MRFFPHKEIKIILSGSVDQTVRIWCCSIKPGHNFKSKVILTGHTGSINCLAVLAESGIFASGAADGTVRIWSLLFSEDNFIAKLLQKIVISPRFFPLALALDCLVITSAPVLAVGGTKSIIQIFVAEKDEEHISFSLKATLTGHEAWIRSLDFAQESSTDNDLLLASASQDRYIRLWRVHCGERLPVTISSVYNLSPELLGKSLSNKVHPFEVVGSRYSLTFEALLLGHEDWIYTTSWKRRHGQLQLLSASADNSLAIWELDVSSGIWVCATRLGEISAQKGSTSATGSTGGFWIGLWSPDGNAVVSLGRTGSWRIWKSDTEQNRWTQGLGVSGHVKSVKSISWSENGSCLLSTSSDQTTRLHAEWKNNMDHSWHEFTRPQIHGYDLNCVKFLNQFQFISGADEKLLRVFTMPRAIAEILEKLCGSTTKSNAEMPDAANIPVLGLSNKAVDILEDGDSEADNNIYESQTIDPESIIRKRTISHIHPPLEGQLARHTLWPEKEKLYGHGYEISAVTASHNGAVVATACKASSLEHAVIRLYETFGWREVKPALKSHLLTVTCLRFTDEDSLLLSVGRDRQWTVFIRDESNIESYKLKASNPKGHSRMILSASWAPSTVGRCFVTAGRDKLVKVWGEQSETFECKAVITTSMAASSLDFLPELIGQSLVLAIGTETGDLLIARLNAGTLDLQVLRTVERG